MTLTELRYIVAVARERHFGRAAESCYVSQPTLSVAVKKLEEELGVQIFERGPAEVTVTPAGGRVVEQAQRALEEAEKIRNIAKSTSDPLEGTFKLGRHFHHRALPAAATDSGAAPACNENALDS